MYKYLKKIIELKKILKFLTKFAKSFKEIYFIKINSKIIFFKKIIFLFFNY